MTIEDRPNRKKIQVWISLDLWEKVVSLGLTNQTTAVTQGLEALVVRSQFSNEISQENQVLKARIEEKDVQILELTKKYDDMFTLHTNYMGQMQTLITKNLLEPAGPKKRFWEFWK
jgi:hypothetical protein